jgi:hypothetical protein
MKKQLFQLGIALLSILTVSATYAAPYASNTVHLEGFYLQAGGGANHLQNQHFSSSGTVNGNTVGGEVRYDTGWNAGVNAGVKRGSYRADFGVHYLHNSIDSIKGTNLPGGDKTGVVE